MSFTNRVRLPFYLSRPQYPTEMEIYLRTDGKRVVNKSIIAKEFEGETDYLPQKIHERLIIALQHDIVNLYSLNFQGPARISGSYEIDWIKFLDYPVAMAKFKAFDESFIANNTSCKSCDDDVKMVLVDDNIPGAVNEGSVMDVNVVLNDRIFCQDPVFSILSFNPDLVASAVITQLGVATITMKGPLSSTTRVELVRYQVVCGDQVGSAGIFGSVNGTLAAICKPAKGPITVENLPGDPMPLAMRFTWLAADDAPADGYNWYLSTVNASGETLITSGNVDGLTVDVNGLDPLVDHVFEVRAACGVEDESAPLRVAFTTPGVQDPADPEPAGVVNLIVSGEVLSGGDPFTYRVTAMIEGGVLLTNTLTVHVYVTSYNSPGGFQIIDIVIPAGNNSGSEDLIFNNFYSETPNVGLSGVKVQPNIGHLPGGGDVSLAVVIH